MKDIATDAAALRVSLAFPTKYLSAADLAGKSCVVEISNVAREDLPVTGGSKRTESKFIISIKGASKQWVLNKTCARALQRLYGDEMRGWVGKRIELYPDVCVSFGVPNTPCVRVRAPQEQRA